MSFAILILFVACLGSIDAFVVDSQIVFDEIDFSRLNGMQWYGVAHSSHSSLILPEDVTCNVIVGFMTNDDYVITKSHQYFIPSAEDTINFRAHNAHAIRTGPGLYRFDENDDETLKTFGLRSQCQLARLPETDIRHRFFKRHVAYITDYQEYLVQIACHSFPDNCETWFYTPQTNPAASQLFKAQDQLWAIGVKSVLASAGCLNASELYS